jgi:hypothetical protein
MLGVKAEFKILFSICPKVLMNAEVYGPKVGKRIPLHLGGQFATLGAKQQAKNAQN